MNAFTLSKTWYLIDISKRGRSYVFVCLFWRKYDLSKQNMISHLHASNMQECIEWKGYLSTTHHRYSGIWPKEHEVRTISTTTHCIISSTEAPTNNYGNFGNLNTTIGKGAGVNHFFHIFLLLFSFLVINERAILTDNCLNLKVTKYISNYKITRWTQTP